MMRRVIWVVMALGLVWSLAACGEADANEAAPATGHFAPDFTLRTPDGTAFRLNDLRGHPVMVNFWATFCPPCMAELPAIQAAYSDHQAQGLVVVGVNQKESAQVVRDFAGPLGITFPLLIDPLDTAGQAYHITALPVSFFIDDEGVIRDVVFGALTPETLEEHLKTILKPA
jgi:cytochrome c biogenesis protein CcmG, thiol:disulfide interchange protein DsbE